MSSTISSSSSSSASTSSSPSSSSSSAADSGSEAQMLRTPLCLRASLSLRQDAHTSMMVNQQPGTLNTRCVFRFMCCAPRSKGEDAACRAHSKAVPAWGSQSARSLLLLAQLRLMQKRSSREPHSSKPVRSGFAHSARSAARGLWSARDRSTYTCRHCRSTILGAAELLPAPPRMSSSSSSNTCAHAGRTVAPGCLHMQTQVSLFATQSVKPEVQPQRFDRQKQTFPGKLASPRAGKCDRCKAQDKATSRMQLSREAHLAVAAVPCLGG